MYGIAITDKLSADNQGYVYWNGVEVEHYNDPFSDDAQPRLMTLADRCRYIETLGFKPTGNLAVGYWDIVKGLKADNPYLDLLMHGFYEVCTRSGAALFSFHFPNGEVEAVVFQGYATFFPAEDWEWNESYHRRRKEGWTGANLGQDEGQGVWGSNAEVLTLFLESYQVPVDLHVQARKAYELLFQQTLEQDVRQHA